MQKYAFLKEAVYTILCRPIVCEHQIKQAEALLSALPQYLHCNVPPSFILDSDFPLLKLKKKKKKTFCLSLSLCLPRQIHKQMSERENFVSHTHTHTLQPKADHLLKIIILSVVSIQFSPDPQTKIQNNEGSIKETVSL